MKRGAAFAAVGAIAALAPALVLFDFTVDDALIPARYAAHLARGLGYRFNALGAATDGVTPLGFPYLLAPFAKSVASAFVAAKIVGLVAWIAGAASLGVAIASASRARSEGEKTTLAAAVGLVIVATSAPLAAWSVAGLETGLAIGLAATAVTMGELDRPKARAVLAGLAAALRPELLPWALIVGGAPRPRREAWTMRDAIPHALVALAPFAIVVALRVAIFHRPAPLAILAKPSDLEHGAVYALVAFVATGPIALVAPLAWRRLDGWPRALLAATLAHFVAIAAAGGDWMPLARLAAPVVPCVALAAVYVARVAGAWASALRLALALAGAFFPARRAFVDGRHVGADRARLVATIAPALEGATVIAALDVGWVGEASDATIVDLAGLTDPAIASLPGGHTSKAIPATLLDSRKVDAIVLELAEEAPSPATPWTASRFARRVEARVASIPGLDADFELVATSDLPHLHYVVARRKRGP